MTTHAHDKNYKQVHLTVFDCSSKNDIAESNFSTSETNFVLNPCYRCRPRRGHGIFSDYLNAWKLQEEPADYSRKDIAVAYRLGSGF